MRKREMVFEIVMAVLAIVFAVLCALIAAIDVGWEDAGWAWDWDKLLSWLVLWIGIGLPSMILAGCSWCVRKRKFAPRFVLVAWVCVLLLGVVVGVLLLSDRSRKMLLFFLSLTVLTGPLAVLTARWSNGWRIVLWASFFLPALLVFCVAGVLR